jgi:hypothetical protein
LRLHGRPGRNYLYLRSDRDPEPPASQPQAVRVAAGIMRFQIVREPPNKQ